jgi:hypothetical protein
LYGTSVGGRHGRPWIGSCGCGFRRRHRVRCFRVRAREHSGRTAGATPPRSRSGPPSTGSGQRLVSALADAGGGHGGRAPVPPGPDTAGASMCSRWDHRPRRDCGRAGDLGTEVPRAAGERRRRAQPDLGNCADDGRATGRGKVGPRRSAGQHPVEQDSVGDRATDAAQPRSHGCHDVSCLIPDELSQLGDGLLNEVGRSGHRAERC